MTLILLEKVLRDMNIPEEFIERKDNYLRVFCILKGTESNPEVDICSHMTYFFSPDKLIIQEIGSHNFIANTEYDDQGRVVKYSVCNDGKNASHESELDYHENDTISFRVDTRHKVKDSHQMHYDEKGRKIQSEQFTNCVSQKHTVKPRVRTTYIYDDAKNTVNVTSKCLDLKADSKGQYKLITFNKSIRSQQDIAPQTSEAFQEKGYHGDMTYFSNPQKA